MGVLAHVVGINFTLELFSAYLNIIKFVFSLVLSTHMYVISTHSIIFGDCIYTIFLL
jgi:hypothetical protein